VKGAGNRKEYHVAIRAEEVAVWGKNITFVLLKLGIYMWKYN